MNKTVLAISSIILIAGVGGLIYWGNTPEKTYYPNGTLRSQVERSFFVKKGLYTQYLPDGERFEVLYKDGKREGKGKLLQKKHIVMEIPFRDGKMDGEIVFNGIKTGVMLKGNTFKFDKEPVIATGKVNCEPEEVLDRLSSTSMDMSEKIEKGLQCLTIEFVKTSDELPIKATFNGAFTFPKFTKTSSLDLFDKDGILFSQTDDIPKELTQIVDAFKVDKISLTIDKNNKDITLKSFLKSGKLIGKVQIDAYNLSGLLSILPKAATDPQKAGKDAFNILKNLAFTNFESYNPYSNKPEVIFEGRISPMLLDIEKGTTFKISNPQDESIFTVKTIKDGFTLYAGYPMSGKKLLDGKITFDSPDISQFTKKLKEAKTLDQWGEVIDQVPKSPKLDLSVDTLDLFDNNGTKLITIKDTYINIEKKDLSARIVLFPQQENEQILQIVKINAPVIVKDKNETKSIDFDDIPDYITKQLHQPILNDVIEPLTVEAQQFIQQYPQSFIGALYAGGIAGYSMAMNRHKVNEILDYATRCAVFVETTGDGKTALPAASCTTYTNEAIPNAQGLNGINVERKENGNIIVEVAFSTLGNENLQKELASRTGVEFINVSMNRYFQLKTENRFPWTSSFLPQVRITTN